MANLKSIGRPTKISIEEKKSIILKYFVEIAECNPKVMREKNIYKQLSNFAKKSGRALESYDFSEVMRLKHIFTNYVIKIKLKIILKKIGPLKA